MLRRAYNYNTESIPHLAGADPNMFKKLKTFVNAFGINWLAKTFLDRLPFHLKGILFQYVVNKAGLEIGGPTSLFRSRRITDVYSIVKSIDNVNFAVNTLWNNGSYDSQNFFYGEKVGKEIISEASDLSCIEDQTYDFCISSHVLEHLSNPLKAIFEMKRVIKAGGHIIIIAPHKDITFDHNRKITSVQHMIDDFKNNVQEGDLSHLDMNEIIDNYDYSMDSGISTKEEFIERCGNNRTNRALHQHVFTTEIILKLADYANLKIVCVKPRLSYGIMVVATKLENYMANGDWNSKFLSPDAGWRIESPFLSDKI